ncbi:T9SS type A sorting domain-containing protein [candidate division KSB1 bacterium]
MNKITFLLLTLMLISFNTTRTFSQTNYNAVLVGIDEYGSPWEELEWSVNDATDFASQLYYNHGWDLGEWEVLADGEAEEDEIYDYIGAMDQSSGHTVLFHFTGHCGSGLITYDQPNYISPAELSSEFSTNKCIVTLSCCAAGMFTNYFSKGVVLASCAYNETSYEDDEIEHSIFGYYLLDGLEAYEADSNSNDRVSAEELFHYAEDKTTAHSYGTMHPQLKDSYSGELSITAEPEIPANFELTNDIQGQNPNFKWNVSADADEYNIYRRKVPNSFSKRATISDTTWTDNTLEIDHGRFALEYEYYATAENSACESSGSDTATVWIENRFPKITRTIPTTFKLEQNYPNPFNPMTTIRYQLPKPADVTLVIYDVGGKEVARLVDGPRGPGFHAEEWNASDVASGVYIYKLTAGDFTDVKRMILVK